MAAGGTQNVGKCQSVWRVARLNRHRRRPRCGAPRGDPPEPRRWKVAGGGGRSAHVATWEVRGPAAAASAKGAVPVAMQPVTRRISARASYSRTARFVFSSKINGLTQLHDSRTRENMRRCCCRLWVLDGYGVRRKQIYGVSHVLADANSTTSNRWYPDAYLISLPWLNRR